MGLLNVIRKLRLRQGLPIREIARRTGLSRNTIKKYLKADVIEPHFATPERPSKLAPIPERPGLPLHDCQVMPPVVDRLCRKMVAALDHAHMFAQDVSLSCHDQPVGVDPKADRPVRKGCRDAVAIAFKADQAGWRDALADLNEAVKGHRQGHQGSPFRSPDIRDCSGQRAMGSLVPQRDATLLQPGVQRGKIRKVRHALQHLMAGVADVLLDLPPSPAVSNRWRHAGSTQPAAGLQKSGSKT
jgi:hypothetical protein